MLEAFNVESVDKTGLHQDYESWPKHSLKASKVRVGFSIPQKLKGLILTGMGGSGASCDVVSTWASSTSRIPILVWKNFGIPRFSGRGWAAVSVSCSGDTEETLSSLKAAYEAGIYSIAISSGGQLEDFCKSRKIHHVKTPKLKTPRSSLPYLVLPLAKIVAQMGLTGVRPAEIGEAIREMERMKAKIGAGIGFDRNPAKKLAYHIHRKIPIIFSSPSLWPAAVRFQDSLNENSKMHAFADTLPELSHNELESWRRNGSDSYRAVLVYRGDEPPEIKRRIDFLKETLGASGCEHHDIQVVGCCSLGLLLSTIYLLDYASIYTAVLRGVDPMPNPNIDMLKRKLRSNR